jgi:hypothetical protein
MMSDPSSVDKTTVDELTGKLVLLIEEKRAWHETDLMHRQLAAKVKNYVRYVRSPDFSSLHNQRPDQTIVRLISDQQPAAFSVNFFARVAYELSKHGLAFEHQVGEFGTPVAVTPNADAPIAPPPTAAPPVGQPIAAPPPVAPQPPPPPVQQPPPIVEPAPPPAQAPVTPPVAPEPPPVAPQPPPVAAEPPPVTAEPPPVAPQPPPVAAEPPPMAPEPPPPADEPLVVVDPFGPEPVGSEPETFDLGEEIPELEPETLGLELEALEVEAVDPWSGTDDTTEAIEPEPIELIPEPGMGEDESLPSIGSEPVEPAFGFEADGEEAFPDFIGDGESALGQEASELERFIDGEGAGGEEMELIDLQPSGPAQGGLGAVATEEDLPRPPFFPEEEFGRAPYEVDEIDFLDADADTAVIETEAGQKFRLEVDGDAEVPGVTPVEKPSLFRAIAAAFVAAIAGGVVWGLLAVPAGQGAHPLAVAVGLMVGFSVRIRGNGHTIPYRIVGLIFTAIGSAIGAVLAATALTAMEGGLGIDGITTILSDVNNLPTVVQGQFGLVSLVSVALALYLAFRLSASKPSA